VRVDNPAKASKLANAAAVVENARDLLQRLGFDDFAHMR
jgi:hypothetical protein